VPERFPQRPGTTEQFEAEYKIIYVLQLKEMFVHKRENKSKLKGNGKKLIKVAWYIKKGLHKRQQGMCVQLKKIPSSYRKQLENRVTT